MKATKLVTLLLGCVLTLLCLSQESYLRHYSTKEGLPSAETYSVLQDSKGYIWVASDMGVSRFDGYTFKVYTTKNGLTDNTVFKFFEDYKGRIWFLTFSGKLSYFFNDTIYGKTFPVNDKLRDFLGAGYLTGFKVDKHDTLLVSTSKGLLKLIPEPVHGVNSWNRMEIINTKKSFLLNKGYAVVESGKDGNAILEVYDSGKSVFRCKLPLPVTRFRDVLNISNNRLIVFTNDSTIFLDSLGTIQYNDSIQRGTCQLEEGDSMIWIGYLGKVNGIHLYREGNILTQANGFLNGFSVTGILKDSEGGYWISTLEDGLFYLPSQKFTYYTKMGEPFQIPESSLHLVSKKRILINIKSKIFEITNARSCDDFLPFAKDFWFKRGIFWNIYSSPTGEIWLSRSGGIDVVDSSGKKLIKHLNFDELCPKCIEKDSRLIIEGRQKKLWSLNHSSITEIDPQTKEIIKTFPVPSRAETACEDYQGNILIGTVNGLYSLTNDSIIYWGEKNDIFRSRFVDVKKSEGRIIGATRGDGLVILACDSIYQINTGNGLQSDMCRSIYVDDYNIIWVATNTGLNSVRLYDHPFHAEIGSFSVSDGLLSNDNVQVLRCEETVWVMAAKGITAFDPDLAIHNPVPPPVYITRVGINHVFSSPTQIRSFDYGTNFIEINFAGLTYKNAGQQLYKYKLLGYDSTVSYTRNTFVQFTKLPPGDYKFVVSCINSSGIESTSPAVFAFSINAPFYQKWWFSLLVLLFIAISMAGASAFIIRRIRKREIIKTEMNRKIANMELQALRAQMNPHFIFNCLNAIQDFITKNDTVSAKYYLTSFSKLIRKTLDSSRKVTTTLAEEIAFLKLYMDLEKMRFSVNFNYQISVDDKIGDRNIEIPSMILQPFVENAIRHGGIGNLETQGLLKISFGITDNTLVCEIDDNGIGLNQSLKLKSEKVNAGKLHAMDIINDRIRTINEVNKSNIRYTAVDKSEMNPGSTGTEIKILIPLKS